MPLAPPVITATFPSNFADILLLHVIRRCYQAMLLMPPGANLELDLKVAKDCTLFSDTMGATRNFGMSGETRYIAPTTISRTAPFSGRAGRRRSSVGCNWPSCCRVSCWSGCSMSASCCVSPGCPLWRTPFLALLVLSICPGKALLAALHVCRFPRHGPYPSGLAVSRSRQRRCNTLGFEFNHLTKLND